MIEQSEDEGKKKHVILRIYKEQMPLDFFCGLLELCTKHYKGCLVKGHEECGAKYTEVFTYED